MLISNEDEDIIEKFFRQIKRWIRTWRLRYIIIDDSVAKQRDVNLTFRGLIDEKMEVSNFFCRTHSKRTLNRKLDEIACKNVKKHLYDVLYFRKTMMKCDEFLKKIITAAFAKKRQYIKRE